MAKQEKGHTYQRHFSGSSVPVGSKAGRILVNSKDSRVIFKALRRAAKTGDAQKIRISDDTVKALEKLEKSTKVKSS